MVGLLKEDGRIGKIGFPIQTHIGRGIHHNHVVPERPLRRAIRQTFQRGRSPVHVQGSVPGCHTPIGKIQNGRREGAGDTVKRPNAQAGGNERIGADRLFDRVAFFKVKRGLGIPVGRNAEQILHLGAFRGRHGAADFGHVCAGRNHVGQWTDVTVPGVVIGAVECGTAHALGAPPEPLDGDVFGAIGIFRKSVDLIPAEQTRPMIRVAIPDAFGFLIDGDPAADDGFIPRTIFVAANQTAHAQFAFRDAGWIGLALKRILAGINNVPVALRRHDYDLPLGDPLLGIQIDEWPGRAEVIGVFGRVCKLDRIALPIHSGHAADKILGQVLGVRGEDVGVFVAAGRVVIAHVAKAGKIHVGVAE